MNYQNEEEDTLVVIVELNFGLCVIIYLKYVRFCSKFSPLMIKAKNQKNCLFLMLLTFLQLFHIASIVHLLQLA